MKLSCDGLVAVGSSYGSEIEYGQVVDYFNISESETREGAVQFEKTQCEISYMKLFKLSKVLVCGSYYAIKTWQFAIRVYMQNTKMQISREPAVDRTSYIDEMKGN